MKRLAVVLAALLLAVPAAAQWQEVPSGWQEVQNASGGSSLSGTPGGVAVFTDATHVGTDPGLTYAAGPYGFLTVIGDSRVGNGFTDIAQGRGYFWPGVTANGGLYLWANDYIKWRSTDGIGAPDLGLARSGAGVLKVTDGASGAGSILVANGTAAAPSYSFANSPATGFYRPYSNQIWYSINGTDAIQFAPGQMVFPSSLAIAWKNGTLTGGTEDIGLARSGAGVLKVTDGSTGAGSIEVLGVGLAADIPAGTVGLTITGSSPIIRGATIYLQGVGGAAGKINTTSIPPYATNAAALLGGLVAGDLYYTDVAGDWVLKIAH